MSWLFWGAAASGWSAAIGILLLLGARSARRETTQALKLRTQVEPYLLRRVQELGLEMPTPASSTSSLDEVIESLCRLTDQLAAREREQFTETQRMAVARTLPIPPPEE